MLTADLFPDTEDLPSRGVWKQPSADLLVWETPDRVIVWESLARYDDDTDLYIGRTPTLVVEEMEDCTIHVERSFEAAVEFGERLGVDTVWIA